MLLRSDDRVKILFLGILFYTTSVSATRNSPRTASPSSASLSSSTSIPTSPNLPTTSTSIIPTTSTTLPLPSKPSSTILTTITTPTPASPPTKTQEENPLVTPPPEFIIDEEGHVLTLIHDDDGGVKRVAVGVDGLQEKWHLTTFFSCHTFDATYTYCGLHEPVLPGGDEIAAAVRPWNAKDGVGRAVVVVLGALVGVDVFLR